MDIISNTPWWVYLLFLYLVGIGLNALRPRTISIKRLILIPGILTIWNIAFLMERLSEKYFFLLFWVVGLSIGVLIGWQTVHSWETKADQVNKTLHLPATWSTLILILLVFAVRYFFLFHYELYPQFYNHFFLADSISSGVITGIFVGRSLELYQKYKKG